jgi:hypothetical protein
VANLARESALSAMVAAFVFSVSLLQTGVQKPEVVVASSLSDSVASEGCRVRNAEVEGSIPFVSTKPGQTAGLFHLLPLLMPRCRARHDRGFSV